MQPELLHIKGETFVGLKDPAGIQPGVMLLSPLGYQLTQLMDGLLERPQILEQAHRRWGIRLQPEQLDQLLDSLEERYALDNARSRGYLAELPARPAVHAGGAYPAQPDELRAFLDRLLEGPEQPPAAFARAYFIPHIDPGRGRSSYAQAWNSLRASLDEFDTFVVLGISHAYAEHPFILTRKDFATPLGVLETDRELVDRLAEGLPFDPFLDEFNHFGEHSIEFQAVFLRHLCARPVRLVPVLCGSFQACLEQPGWPEAQPGVEAFLEKLRLVLAERPRTCWIASVDLAHVGQRFGGAPLTPADLAALERRDRETMEKAVAGRPREFLETLQADVGQRNYCGTSAIYSLLQALRPAPGQLLCYQQCNEPGLTSTVTVAAARFP